MIIVLGLVLVLFMMITALLVWFSFKMVKRVFLIEEGVTDLREIVKNFYEHLEEVNQMDTYHGEPVIQSLVDHSKNVVLRIKGLEKLFVITEETLQGEDDIEETEDRQSVFYEGSRGSNSSIRIIDKQE